jgi:hypothetical protein
MLWASYSKLSAICFILPNKVVLVGDFLDWNQSFGANVATTFSFHYSKTSKFV